jgi:hypothetical protein
VPNGPCVPHVASAAVRASRSDYWGATLQRPSSVCSMWSFTAGCRVSWLAGVFCGYSGFAQCDDAEGCCSSQDWLATGIKSPRVDQFWPHSLTCLTRSYLSLRIHCSSTACCRQPVVRSRWALDRSKGCAIRPSVLRCCLYARCSCGQCNQIAEFYLSCATTVCTGYTHAYSWTTRGSAASPTNVYAVT